MGVGLSGSLRRTAAIALLTGLIGTGLAAVAAPQAAAGTDVTLYPSSWAYTDSATPTVSHLNPDEDAPVGAQTTTAGTTYQARSYFTFDLAPVAGRNLFSATLYTTQTSVAECSALTTPQAWLTDTATSPTWAEPPTERQKLGGLAQEPGCPSYNVQWTATQVVRAAIADNQSQATIELRLPDKQEADPAHGFTVDPEVALVVRYNSAPAVPTGLTVGQHACSATPVPVGYLGTESLPLKAQITDADDDSINAEFDWWPAGHPDQRHELYADPTTSQYPATVRIPAADLTDGTTYAWRVRGNDGTANGPFSPVCKFSTDFTAPTTAPTVTSADYPDPDYPGSGGTGITGNFTLSANGSRDITGFLWDIGPVQTSPIFPATANHPGGTATIAVAPPLRGTNYLTVVGVDEAGNGGPVTTYKFYVVSDPPTVSCTPDSGYVGTPRQCTFTSNLAGVTGFQYRFGSAPDATTVPVGPDGSATVTLTPGGQDPNYILDVAAVLPGGHLTDQAETFLQVDDGAPVVDVTPSEVAQGDPVQCTLHAVLPGSVTFTYTWGSDDPVTVPVGPDGSTTVALHADQTYDTELDVFSTTAAGVQSGANSDSQVSVRSGQPVVSSADYPEYGYGGGPGVPGTFTFSSPVSSVTGYTYRLDSGDDVTVPAGPDGTASVVVTPDTDGYHSLTVTGVLPDGAPSDQEDYQFIVNSPALAATHRVR